MTLIEKMVRVLRRLNSARKRATAGASSVLPGIAGGDGILRYKQHVASQLETNDSEDVAMEQAVGGDFEWIGRIERSLLVSVGLKPDGSVVDVGCGSGRLAKPLSDYLTGNYLGTDVVPDLISYARRLVNRPDWTFQVVDSLSIPAPDHSADLVCFFSVFTHLLHEETFTLLEEAKRVLKSDGCIVFSFLEFAVPGHWAVFEATKAAMGTALHLNQFMSRDAIDVWAEHLDLEVDLYLRGDEANIPIDEPVTLADGRVLEDLAALGQSVAVLRPR
jgi:SAM-dependent methyltransferase